MRRAWLAEAVRAADGGRGLTRAWCSLAVAVGVTVLVAVAAMAQEAPRVSADTAGTPADAGALFDAVVERIGKSFWDKELIASSGWERRAAEVRPNVLAAPTREAAAGRINALLAELKTSHTGLFTPDDVEYYILLDVFSGSSRIRDFVAQHFWGSGVSYAGVGLFSVNTDGRDFVDAILEGSPADRAGIKVGDEVLSVDGMPYHPIRSFRGKIGDTVTLSLRRAAEAAPQAITVEVVSIAPLRAFRDATTASARVIERDGRRIGYVHVWASVGDNSTDALREALDSLNGDKDQDHRDGKRHAATPQLDGVIIDMRGKIGGTGQNAARYLDLIDPRGPLMRSRNKDGKDHSRDSLRGRTAVLIDQHTRSTGELFVHAYKRERQGPLIGTHTAGAVSAAAAYVMPGGDLLYLAVTGLEIDGEILEGPGVAPDIEVARPLPYANGADPVLEAGIDTLVRRAQAPPPAANVPNRSN
ncbi:MAG TPA: S41 family peptidase [Hyphomicrobiaceae bacterium]|nr:S41 family peptidase [Hyphomicrobiaceae bacterium]